MKTTLARLSLAGMLCSALVGCFQTSLTGTTGSTVITVVPLRGDGNVVLQTQSRSDADLLAQQGEDTWNSYAALVKQLFIGSSASFDTTLIEPNTLYLVTATGGSDFLSRASATELGSPEPVQGSWHAIVAGARLRQGSMQISVLSDALYRQAVGRLSVLSDADILTQLDAAARLVVRDVNRDSTVDYNDVLSWTPLLHLNQYVGDPASVSAMAQAIRNGQPSSMLDEQAKQVLGSQSVVLSTNQGDISVETLNWEAPVTVDNFLGYVNAGFYDNMFFHRVINGFVIQAGLLEYIPAENAVRIRQAGASIRNESRWSVSNNRGTLAMARTDDPDSAIAQFYINQVDNGFLDFDTDTQADGYAVFARVTAGLSVVDSIASVATGTLAGLGLDNVPLTAVYIMSARQTQ